MPSGRRPFYWIESLFWSLHSYTWDDLLQTPKDRERIRARVNWLASHRQCTGERVLDVGCGTGNYVLALAEAGFSAVGIDFAQGMLRKAKEKAARSTHGHASVAFEWGDLNQALDFPNDSFDHAICIYAFQCVADPPRFLAEIGRVVKPSGLLLIAAPQPDTKATMPAMAPLPKRAFWKLKAFASRSNRVQKPHRDELVALLASAGFHLDKDRTNDRTIELLCRAQGT
jgi:ubiquinone/menaquinone biosynthesis C-methylase UbiE